MASTATDILRLDLQATGDNPNAWGVRLNQSLKLLDEAAGGLTIDLTGDLTLTSNNYTSDQSRRAALRFTGAGNVKVIVPSVSKLYFIDNRCAADITIKTVSNAGSVVRAGTQAVVFIDGTTTTVADPTLDKIKPPVAAVAMNGQKLTGLAAGTTLGEAITYEQSIGYSDAAAASATLAMQWAMSLNLVDATYRGARFYALAAADSAAAAATFDPTVINAAIAAVDTKANRALRVARLYTAATFP